MAEDKVESREVTWRQLLPWTELFRGFQVALDLNKLFLAAAGILAMAAGWWLLSIIFGAGYSNIPPEWPGPFKSGPGTLTEQWARFRFQRDQWNLMHETAGIGDRDKIYRYQTADLALSPEEYDLFQNLNRGDQYEPHLIQLRAENKINDDRLKQLDSPEHVALYRKLGQPKPYAQLASWPWFENRGPNPFLLVTAQAGIPWQPGRFWDWFLRDQGPVLMEPLAKFLMPVRDLFRPGTSFSIRFYFLCVFVWTVLVWAFFGGAITRIAVVQVARGEKIGASEALRFTIKRFLSYLTAPLFPLAFVFFLMFLMMIYGAFGMIPVLGDIVVSGLLWPAMLVFGLIMAVALVGLVGWPLMSATVSAEGTDSWEAVSRSYSYVYQRPWHYIWYTLVAVFYGAALVFFVVFMGSFTVYLAKWGVDQTPGIHLANREPSYLFLYAPSSWDWRPLLLSGATVDGGTEVVQNGVINPDAYNAYYNSCSWYNKTGAGLVAFWVYLFFLLILGFSYSYFWSAGSIIYLLMRRNVDAAEIDEVYLEDEDQEGPYGSGTSITPPVASSAVKTSPTLTMVEAPSLRSSSPPPPPAAVPTSTSTPASAPLASFEPPSAPVVMSPEESFEPPLASEPPLTSEPPHSVDSHHLSTEAPPPPPPPSREPISEPLPPSDDGNQLFPE